MFLSKDCRSLPLNIFIFISNASVATHLWSNQSCPIIDDDIPARGATITRQQKQIKCLLRASKVSAQFEASKPAAQFSTIPRQQHFHNQSSQFTVWRLLFVSLVKS